MKKITYLKPIVNFLLLGLCITTLSRIVLFFLFKERVVATENYGYLFPIGLRMDLILLCYISLLPAVLISLFPEKWIYKIQSFLTVYFIFFLSLLLFFELATPNFIAQYDTRPNQLFIEYLIYPKEVIGMLYKGYLPSILATIVFLSAFIYAVIRFRKQLFGVGKTSYKTKLLLFPLVAFLLFLVRVQV